MLKNYLKIALRTLIRDKSYAAINILGLAVGIAGATMLLMYVSDELSYDSFHDDADRIFRVVTEDRTGESTRYFGETFTPLGKRATESLPDVEDQVTIYQTRSQINFRLEGRRITEESWWMVDDNFFEFFNFQLISGQPNTVLDQPHSIVLSESLARKYFGNEDPLGKTINEFDWGDLVVTGIFKDLPQNSHLRFDLLVSANLRQDDQWREYVNSWDSPRAYTYLKVNAPEHKGAFESELEDLLVKHRGQQTKDEYNIRLQALTDIHFESAHIELGTDLGSKGDRVYILVFGSIAIFLLIIAAFNYTNLATSKAIFRAKEIGVRKVVGAQKSQLSIQFLFESVLVTVVALVASVGLIDLAMPYFNEITGKSFEFGLQTLVSYGPLLLGIGLVSALFSGLYPALFITRFKPARVLKGERSFTNGRLSLRRVLVVIQFSLSIIMIVATLVVFNQLQFVKNTDPGFATEGVLVVDINSYYTRRDFKSMKEAFNAIPGVETASAVSRVPGEWKTITELTIKSRDEQGRLDSLRLYYMGFDAEAQKTFDFNIKSGTYFRGNDQSDSTKILLNETAVKALGLLDPVGKTLRLERTSDRVLNATIIGVVEDFNFQSFHTKIAPLVIGSWNSGLRSIDYFAMKVNTGNVSQIIDQVTAVHNQYDPATTIEYNFLDEQLRIKYEQEQRAGTIFQLGAGLSVFVACLGLFGLASFTVQKRAKELGIRKVLGASVWNIFYLLSSSFVRQVVVAFLISSPLAYLLMNNWLSDFSYRITLGVEVFLLAGGVAMLIALLTVSQRSLKAANSNPVDSLKDE